MWVGRWSLDHSSCSIQKTGNRAPDLEASERDLFSVWKKENYRCHFFPDACSFGEKTKIGSQVAPSSQGKLCLPPSRKSARMLMNNSALELPALKRRRWLQSVPHCPLLGDQELHFSFHPGNNLSPERPRVISPTPSTVCHGDCPGLYLILMA